MKQSTFLNIWNWYCVERTCFWISLFGSAGSNAVRTSYTATHTQELFCNISLHGERTVFNHNRFVLQFCAKFFLLFTPTRLWQVSLGFRQGHAKKRGFVSTETIGSFHVKSPIKKTILNPTLSEFHEIWHTCSLRPPNLKSKIVCWLDDRFPRYVGLIF